MLMLPENQLTPHFLPEDVSFDSVSKLSIVNEVWPTGGIMVANDVSSYDLHNFSRRAIYVF